MAHHRDPAAAGDGSHSLPREVRAISESVEVLGLLQRRRDAQPVSCLHGGAARQPEQDAPRQRVAPSIRTGHLHPVDDDLLALAARPGVVNGGPGERSLLRSDQGGDTALAEWQRHGGSAPCAERHGCNRDPEHQQRAPTKQQPGARTSQGRQRRRPQVHRRRGQRLPGDDADHQTSQRRRQQQGGHGRQRARFRT